MDNSAAEKLAVVFHWWNDNVNVKPYLDKFNPVVLAVACVRSNNPDVSIYVVDASDCTRPDSDWSSYPYKLDFKVIKVDSFLRELQSKFKDMYNLRLFSRVWDVELSMRTVPENKIMFIDADIFFLQPFSAVGRLEHFHASKNNGIWLYDKRSNNAKCVFDAWKGMVCRTLHDDDFRREIFRVNPLYGTYLMQDEIIYRTLALNMQNHVRPINLLDNYLFYWIYNDPPEVVGEIRGLHCLSFVVGKDRLKLFLVIAELWAQLKQVFDKKDLQILFDGELPTETMSLCDFHFSESAVDRFLELIDFDESYFKRFTADMRKNDYVRIRLL